ncbi:mechanosensitive ion channel family protein [Leadbettera azotonutricia]|uniref:MscS Mechanosensitive ion channel n=1 Tax=Leadbettera azotonutricia (strain ATCC BAA-888 / DSM 13862 / ZAS-9) TaxID=545695 RepID=F5YCP8_LEAAZ|nr:mechanosensitive ion channel family protein [Leadbettera azotonutricia]AEF82229.1 MscS Mechanosensitive ion channel [Leadbettera azotonutricia ZAS-9]
MNKWIFELWANYSDAILGFGRKLLVAAIIIVLRWLLIRLGERLIHKATTGKIQFDETLASALKLVINYGSAIICIIMILDLFGVNTASLIALLGAAGVAVGLALKNTLSNIAAGIILLVQRSFKKGDIIECGAVSGIVREMDLFTTRLENSDGIFISVPNSALWGPPLKNFSRNNKRRIDFTVTVTAPQSADDVFAVLKDAAAGESRFLPQHHPQIVVQSIGENSVTVMLRAWVYSRDYAAVYADQVKNIREKFEAAGLAIPFPQSTIQVVKD